MDTLLARHYEDESSAARFPVSVESLSSRVDPLFVFMSQVSGWEVSAL